MSPFRSFAPAWFALLPLLLAAAPTVAQEGEPAPPAPAEPVDPGPAPIPAAEIVEEANTLQDRISTMQKLATITSAITAIEEAVPAMRDKTSDFEVEVEKLEGRSTSALEDLETRWALQAEQVRSWNGTLTRHIAKLDQALAELATRQNRWDVTRGQAADAELPENLLARLTTALQAIETASSDLLAARDELFALQEVVVQGEHRIQRFVNAIREAKEHQQRRILVKDQPSIRGVLTQPRPGLAFGAFAESLRQSFDTLDEFLAAHWPRVLVHFGVLAFCVVLVLRLRGPARKLAEEDESYGPTARILAHPLSGPLLIAFVARKWVFPHTPQAFESIWLIALLVPIVRLLPGLMPSVLKSTPFFLAGWALTNHLRQVLLPLPLVSRGVLLLEAIFVLAYCSWFFLPKQRAALKETAAWAGRVSFVLYITFATVSLGLGAALLGYVHLAEYLHGAAFGVALASLGLYLLATVIIGIIMVALRTRAAQRLAMARDHGDIVLRRAEQIVRLGVLVWWVTLLLDLFGIKNVVWPWVVGVVNAPLTFGTITLSLADVLAFFFVVWLANTISRLIRFVLDEDVFPRTRLPRGVPFAITSILHYSILLVGFLVALAAAGVELSKFSILAGAFGIGIGFGLQNIVNNFVSGLILLFERPIQPGDTLEVGATSLFGRVKQIGIRASTIRTYDGAELIVPNADLVANQVVNWTLSDRNRRIRIPIGVAYGSDPQQVVDLLLKIAKEDDDALEIPVPSAFFMGFGESSLDFELRFWTSRFDDRWEITSRINLAIYRALAEADIEIPFPQRDLHVRSIDEAIVLPRANAASLAPPAPAARAAVTPPPPAQPTDD